LQQVTDFPNICYSPNWINEGANILVGTELEGDPYARNYILTADGQLIDSIDLFFHPNISARDNRLATSIFVDGERHIGYYDLNTEDMIITSAVPQSSSTPVVTWIDENNLAYHDNTYGIYQLNLLTEEVTLLREECDNIQYNDLHASPQTNGILYFAETRRILIDSTSFDSKTRIYKLNVYTDEQWLVDLEE